MKTHIIYVPGLGDGYWWLRSFALSFWYLWGVETTHVRLNWSDGQSMETKLAATQQAIDVVPANRRIVVIGESAGATLALHTTSRNQRVERVITLCGVARPTTPIASQLRMRTPALGQAVDSLMETYTFNVVCVRAAVDAVVNKRYSVIPGASEHVIWSIGHLWTIALCLTALGPYMARLAKK